MSDRELMAWLCKHGQPTAARRIRELKFELARANQRLGLYQHHASKKKGKK